MSQVDGPAASALGGAADPAGDVHIDRLALRVAGLDEDAARALAQLVAEGLAPSMLRATGSADVASLQVEVQASVTEQEKPDLLARRIADEIGQALARGRVPGGPDGEAVP
jgi:hypothetical protein